MLILISDFDMRGSGYANIAISLCNELAIRHKRSVTALGISYAMTEHNWPFSVIPVNPSDYLQHIPAIIHNYRALAEAKKWDDIECIVTALDIPIQEKLMQIDRGSIPYVGVFPIESGPLTTSWTNTLSQMTERLVISEFGSRMLEDVGLASIYLPVGIDTASWRRPSEKERAAIRKSLGFKEGEFVVLTVADNQERKNLSVSAEAISIARKSIDAKWILVTRVNSPVGWKLDDLAAYFDITEACTKFDRGLPFDRMWFLYAAADAFLLTSKAEGLCLPVLEAMACGTPVVATDCTAMPEHLFENPDWKRIQKGTWRDGKPKGQRGFPIKVEFSTIDPWGNSVRSFASARDAAEILVKLSKTSRDKLEPILASAAEYAKTRTWQRTGDVLEETIRSAINKTVVNQQSPAGQLPASVPRPVPPVVIEDLEDQNV